MKRYSFVTLFVLLSLLLNSSPLVGIRASRAVVPSSDLPATIYADYAPAAVDQFAVPASWIGDEGVRFQMRGTQSVQASGPITFTKHIVDSNFSTPEIGYATDLDRDGDVDILGTSYYGATIAWWENDGSQGFAKHIIDNGFGRARTVYAADVDGDEDTDVLGASAWGGIAWWENNGSQVFTKHTINDKVEGDGARCVFATDLDKDGDVDILGTAYLEGFKATYWWENDGNENFSEHTVNDTSTSSYWAHTADVDDDGDIDVLSAGGTNMSWWENDGSENFSRHLLDDTFDGAAHVVAVDIDDDGDMDVLGAAKNSDEIAWWENNGAEVFTKHIVADALEHAHHTYPADLDNDGDVDILGAVTNASTIAWWENDGVEHFTQHTVDDQFSHTLYAEAVDIDKDGDLDILGSAYNLNDIAWYENTSGTSDTTTIQGQVVDASTESGIEGALVQAGVYTTTTGTDGRYSLTVNPGEYQITARESGYYASNSSVNVASGDMVSVNFKLASRTGTGFGVWIGKYEDGLAGASDQQVEDILEDIALNGGSIVYFPAYDPITSTTETISGTFLFTETLLWNGTVTDTHISFDPSYTYSLSSLVNAAHSDNLNLKVYASIPCFSTGGEPEQYIIPDAPTNARLQEHLIQVAQYLLQYDVDGVILDFIRYPSIEAGSVPTGEMRAKNITGFVEMMKNEISGEKLALTTWAPTPDNVSYRGQDLSQLAELHPAAISPQLYADKERYPNYEGDNDLETLRGYDKRARTEIGNNAQYIPVFQAYDSEKKDHICKPGGEGLLAAIAAAHSALINPFDNFAVFAYEHLSSLSDSCTEKAEWPQLAAFIPQPWYAKIIDAMTGTIASGDQDSFQFINETVSELILTIRWSGGESAGTMNQVGGTTLASDVLEVQMYKPDGTLYGTFDLTDSIEVITIPGAEAGTWECRLTTTSAVSQGYTIVVGAVTYQVYLPIALKNR
jgi:hypothetical protein